MRDKLDRRLFLAGAAGLTLAGCDRLANSEKGQKAFDVGSDLTYEASKALPQSQLAHEYPASAITKIFKPNGSIDPKDPAYKKLVAETFASFAMPVGGLVEQPRSFTLADLRALQARTQITRHDCVEGWSCIGQWSGVQLRTILDLVKPKPAARYVVFNCFDHYATDYMTGRRQTPSSINRRPSTARSAWAMRCIRRRFWPTR